MSDRCLTCDHLRGDHNMGGNKECCRNECMCGLFIESPAGPATTRLDNHKDRLDQLVERVATMEKKHSSLVTSINSLAEAVLKQDNLNDQRFKDHACYVIETLTSYRKNVDALRERVEIIDDAIAEKAEKPGRPETSLRSRIEQLLREIP